MSCDDDDDDDDEETKNVTYFSSNIFKRSYFSLGF